MNESNAKSAPSLGSDLKRVDQHQIQPHEYDDLPELTKEMIARGRVNKGGRPRSVNPRRLISIRLPDHVIESWRQSGPGWQTRMAELLEKEKPSAE